MQAITTKELTFSYQGKTILENISFSVKRGETWAVIGRNGAGKSTLLKCLCGLLKPSSGNVFIDGNSVSKLKTRDIAKSTAYVPQGSGRLAPPFTVREYVLMARFPYRIFGSLPDENDKKRVDEALILTGTGHLSERIMGTLSAGEFQAALLAGAVAQDTPFLLLDEPTTYLDPCHQENVRLVIERIHACRHTAVITVTHDINFALSCHNNVLSLIDGKTGFCGSKESFCDHAAEHLSKVFSVKFGSAALSEDKILYFTRGVGL
ncbi:MAG: ABC transporter ATP-binding protein [Chitinispirillales bacterium]|jgi:iron complex transport system ATP-binding protein|nr:ABC transporter ATP-binding protein [Chitinispirillales bacterium]